MAILYVYNNCFPVKPQPISNIKTSISDKGIHFRQSGPNQISRRPGIARPLFHWQYVFNINQDFQLSVFVSQITG